MLPESTRIAMGDRIRHARQKSGLTQSEFSEEIDISVNFLSEIENGKKGFSGETLYNICHKFNVSADYILLNDNKSEQDMNTMIELVDSIDSKDINKMMEFLTYLKKTKDE